jgi:NitT/TauT family transport system permease protein
VSTSLSTSRVARPALRPGRPNVRALATGAIGSLAAGLVIWEILGRAFEITFLPPASDVASRLVALLAEARIQPLLLSSLANLAIGLVISVVGGIGLGLLTGVSSTAAAALDPYINALLTAPSLVFAPIFFSIWGLGRESIVALIVTYAVFVIIVNTAAAVRAAPEGLREMARSFDATPAQTFWQVTLPAATPLILAGVRMGVARAVKGMINGEMFISLIGLGRMIRDAQHQLDATTVLAVLALVVIVSLALMSAIELMDARLTRWLPSTARAR